MRDVYIRIQISYPFKCVYSHEVDNCQNSIDPANDKNKSNNYHENFWNNMFYCHIGFYFLSNQGFIDGQFIAYSIWKNSWTRSLLVY